MKNMNARSAFEGIETELFFTSEYSYYSFEENKN